LSPHTVKSEMKSIYRKLGTTSRTQASPGPGNLGSWDFSPSPFAILGSRLTGRITPWGQLACDRRWERTVSSTVRATSPIVNHRL
jgi:hypothetical protein